MQHRLVLNRGRRKVVLAALASAVPAALAQTPPWPHKIVRIVAAGPAGGSADIVARLLADSLSRQIGQAVIVEARPGAVTGAQPAASRLGPGSLRHRGDRFLT